MSRTAGEKRTYSILPEVGWSGPSGNGAYFVGVSGTDVGARDFASTGVSRLKFWSLMITRPGHAVIAAFTDATPKSLPLASEGDEFVHLRAVDCSSHVEAAADLTLCTAVAELREVVHQAGEVARGQNMQQPSSTRGGGQIMVNTTRLVSGLGKGGGGGQRHVCGPRSGAARHAAQHLICPSSAPGASAESASGSDMI